MLSIAEEVRLTLREAEGLRQIGEYAKAVNWLRLAINKLPPDPVTLDLHHRLRQLQPVEAQDAARRILVQHPDDRAAQLHYAALLAQPPMYITNPDFRAQALQLYTHLIAATEDGDPANAEHHRQARSGRRALTLRGGPYDLYVADFLWQWHDNEPPPEAQRSVRAGLLRELAGVERPDFIPVLEALRSGNDFPIDTLNFIEGKLNALRLLELAQTYLGPPDAGAER